MEETEYSVRIKDLVTKYGDRTILNGINLDICAGETMVILGGSGCGKSTLLRHLVGLAMPTSGSVIIRGQNLVELNEEQMNELLHKVGMAFQGSALFNSMTIGDNVSLSLREHTKLEPSTIEIMTRIKLELVGLSGFENYMPSELSGGMKKRAGVARALAMDPEILLFDEPSAGLDPIVAAGLDHLILKLKEAFRMTIIVVTHELPSAFLIADRITMLDKGKVLFVGTPAEIRESKIERVRQFLDRMPEADTTNEDAYLERLTGRV